MLERYRNKRNFRKTREPSGESSAPSQGDLKFVVQKHAASRLHYDFRLEAEGVLKSWAVPKGPSMDPKDKHLAVMVEDHPLDYAGFEGTIPEGEYGAGEVIVWDEGTYTMKGAKGRLASERAVIEGIEEGKLHFSLFGQKLHGEFVLARMHGDEPKNWLLMKVHDPFESKENVLEQEDSVLSGRSIEDVRNGEDVTPAGSVYEPMLASEATGPFDDDKWQFELKLDGVRAIASKRNGHVSLVSRNGNAIGDHLPKIMATLDSLSEASFVLDGELVFFDEDGRPSFQQLMRRIRPDSRAPVRVESRPGRVEYCVFDLLRLKDADLRHRPLSERRALLEGLGLNGPHVRLVDSYKGTGKLLFERAIEMGFEGIMAKRLASSYQSGQRSKSWLKVKSFHSEEFVVGGFTEGRGARQRSFGGLLLGQRDENGDLRYSGKVGGGFSDQDLAQLRAALDALRTKTSPFSGRVVADERPAWVEPKLVVEVKFLTRTEDHLLRFPVFVRLRPDQEENAVPVKKSPPREPANAIEDVIAQLDRMEDSGEIRIHGRSVRVTHLSKVLWPGAKEVPALDKRDLLRYYARLSDEMLPFLKDRPISFVRHPEGVDAQGFFQKHPVAGTPDFVSRVKIWSEHSAEALDWLLCNDLETLLWLGQVGTVEIHPWYSRIDPGNLPSQFDTREGLEESALDYPDFIVLDLDPNIKLSAKSRGAARTFDPEAWAKVVGVAQGLRDILRAAELDCWVKSSGRTGLHVYVPIERKYRYDEVKAMAQMLGETIEKQRPSDVTMVWTVKKRPNAVFVDHNQNVRGKTLACPFSPRAVIGAPVSFPLKWAEIETFDPTSVTIQNAWDLVQQNGNPWRTILDRPQKLRL